MPDFMGSIIVFSAVITIFLFSWNSVVDNQEQINLEDQMRQDAYYTTTFLVSTPGIPENWTTENVEVPGFATEDNVLQKTKLENFSKISYTRQRRLLRATNFFLEFEMEDSSQQKESLGGENVAYMVESSSDFSDVKLLETLNNSDLSWDLYWPSSSNQDQLDDLTARNVYSYTENGVTMFDDLIENSSVTEYGTLIGEDINIDSSEPESPEELRNYVRNGGTYLHTESDPNLITQTFYLDNSDDDSENALIDKVRPLMKESLEIGDTAEFDDSNAAYDNPDQVFADGTDSDAWCVACMWNKGNGKLYYLSDTFSDNDNVGLAFENADDSIGFDLRFGRQPSNASTVIPLTRNVVVEEGNDVNEAKMRFIVWSDSN